MGEIAYFQSSQSFYINISQTYPINSPVLVKLFGDGYGNHPGDDHHRKAAKPPKAGKDKQ